MNVRLLLQVLFQASGETLLHIPSNLQILNLQATISIMPPVQHPARTAALHKKHLSCSELLPVVLLTPAPGMSSM